jgi:HD-GYP domain-containing protein (c-di-GMP phosphodiesterase class II)
MLAARRANSGLGRPPRLVVRSLTATFGAIALVLGLVFMVLVLNAQRRAANAVTESLDTGKETYLRLEKRRADELAEMGTAFTARAAVVNGLERIASGSNAGDTGEQVGRSLASLVHDLVDRTNVDGAALLDARRSVVATAGRASDRWQTGDEVFLGQPIATAPTQTLRTIDAEAYRVDIFPVRRGGRTIGELHLARVIDQAYANTIAGLIRGRALVVGAGRVLAADVSGEELPAFERAVTEGLPEEGVLTVEGEPFAVLRISSAGGIDVYGTESIRAASSRSVRTTLVTLALIAAGAMLLGALVSLWLARSLSRPIHELSKSLSQMSEARTFETRLARTGTSREVDALTDTFNGLMASLNEAEGQARSAYVGAIKALAAALDARDPYTAGHSDRVSALTVAIGRELRLADDEIEVLRLGALLHDIGKIGVSDNVLRKPGPLTLEEFEAIKAHPRLGSRILKPVAFLAPHLPIVELHHERPDGLGYPHGLAGEEIPLLPRIVRVADAFDAITTARAYRPARPPAEALSELWQGAGTQFDANVVEALVTAWPVVAPTLHRSDAHSTQRLAAAVVPFRQSAGSKRAASGSELGQRGTGA